MKLKSTILLYYLIYNVHSQQYSRSYSNILSNVNAMSLAVDENLGLFYMAGCTANSIDGQAATGACDSFLTQFHENGTRVWTRFTRMSSGKISYINRVRVDSISPGVFVTGFTNSNIHSLTGTFQTTAFIARYYTNGTLHYARYYSTYPSDDIDAAANFFIDPQTHRLNMIGSANFYPGIVFLSYSTGATLGSINVPNLQYAQFKSYTSDQASGALYLCGYSYVSNNFHAFLVKMFLNGTILWQRQWGSSSIPDICVSLVYDPVYNMVFSLYTGGLASGSGSQFGSKDIGVMAHNSNGNLIWSKYFGTTSDDYGLDIFIVEPGTFIYIGGQLGSSFSGNVEWKWDFAVATRSGAGTTPILYKLSNTGDLVENMAGANMRNYFEFVVSKDKSKIYAISSSGGFEIIRFNVSLTFSPVNFASISPKSLLTSTVVIYSSSHPSSIQSRNEPTEFNQQQNSSFTIILSALETSRDSRRTNSPSRFTQADRETIATLFGVDRSTFVIIAAALGIVIVTIILILAHTILRRKKPRTKFSLTRKQTATSSTKSSEVSTAYSGHTTTTSVMSNMTTTTVVPSDTGFAIPGFLQLKFGIDFRLKKILAQGGFGSVHMGDMLRSGYKEQNSTVVVKVYDKEHQSIIVDSLMQEIAVLHYFSHHRNIAKIVGYSDKPWSLVMKYYPYGSLKKWLTNTKNQTNKTILIYFSLDITRGLEVLHNGGFAHCDLKADNVLIDIDPKEGLFCVLTDFGLARVINRSVLNVSGYTESLTRGLSYSHASPELLWARRYGSASQEGEKLLASDLYALGVTIFELIARKFPIYE